MSLSEREIQQIMQRVQSRIGDGHRAGPEILVRSVDEHRLGIFRDVDGAATAARRAYEQYERMSLEARKVIIAAMREQMRKHGDDLAREAHQETGLGRAEDKIRKNR